MASVKMCTNLKKQLSTSVEEFGKTVVYHCRRYEMASVKMFTNLEKQLSTYVEDKKIREDTVEEDTSIRK